MSLMDWKVREYQCFALSVHLLKISGRRTSGETARERDAAGQGHVLIVLSD